MARHLLSLGHIVVGIDNLNDYYDNKLKLYRLAELCGVSWDISALETLSSHETEARFSNQRFTFRYLNIECRADVDLLFSNTKFDAVYNLAARAGVRPSLSSPHLYFATNTIGTLNILEAMRANGVKKHVLASTSSLYAGAEPPFREDFCVDQPLSPYAVSKRSAELLAFTYYKNFEIDTSVVRYFTAYGPAGRPDMAVYRIIASILSGAKIHIYGDGLQARDFTFVNDIVAGTVAAERLVGFSIFNIGGGGKPANLLDVISRVEKYVGQKALLEFHGALAVDMHETAANISKAKLFLHWQPVTDLDKGLQASVAWHVLHPWSWSIGK